MWNASSTRFAGLLLAAAVAIPASAAPEAALVRDLAADPPAIALRHSGRQSAEPNDEFFGRELATGDFNGDGSTDLAVAADYNSLGGDRSPGRGRVFIYFGRGSAFPAELDPADQLADRTIAGAEPFEWFGTELVAGDFDGDGLDDLAVSGQNLGEVYRGRVYLISGTTISAVTEIRMDRGMYATRISGRLDKKKGFYTYFGFSLATGDFNGDGVDDLAAGAFGGRGPADGRPDGGEVTVFLGRSRWPRELMAQQGVADMIVYGRAREVQLGSELATGDLNNDGRDELIAAMWGSHGPDGSRSYAGAVAILDFASKEGVRLRRKAGRRGRGWDLAIVPPSAIVHGPAYNTRIGSSASDGGGKGIAVGDVDGDEYADVVIGSPFSGPAAPNRKNPGTAWVVWGGPSLVKGAVIDLASPGVSASAVAEGAGGDSLGDAVRVADLDGDGMAEVLLGAPDSDGARGYAAIYRGRIRPVAGVMLAEAPDVLIVGSREGWRAADDIVVLDESFAGRPLIGIGSPHGGYEGEYRARGRAGQVEMIDTTELLQ